MTADQFAQCISAMWLGGILGGAIAVFLGGLLRDFFFLFLRRLPAWRRFDRAVSRYFRGLA